MKIFPAIDIKDKKCVRLIKGDFENKTENRPKSQGSKNLFNPPNKVNNDHLI